MIETIYRLFEYDEWAIARILDSLKSMPIRDKKALRSLAHLLVAEKVWILRLQGSGHLEDKFVAGLLACRM